MLLLRRCFFGARSLLDIYYKFMFCLLLVYRSSGVMNLLIDVEIVPPAAPTEP